MPRKRHDGKRRYEVTLELLCVSLYLWGWEDYWGGDREGRAAWEALRGKLRTNHGTRPAPFWAYEPDVPDELRAEPEDADSRLPDHEYPPAHAKACAAERARLEWLIGPGQDHLRPGEMEAILREFEGRAGEGAEGDRPWRTSPHIPPHGQDGRTGGIA